MTESELVRKYHTFGRAAGAVACGVEEVKGADWMLLSVSFQNLILLKQNVVLMRMVGIAVGINPERIAAEWKAQDEEEGL